MAGPGGGWPGVDDLALVTDLYQLTMLQAYHRRGMEAPATFELFVRHMPADRRYLVACGLSSALAYLETLRFDADAIDGLRGLGRFDEAFLAWLGNLRFTGEVWAIPEGEIVYAAEPLLRVTAPLPEAQLVETFLLNAVLHQTGVASKAARCVLAAAARDVVDFSLRRDHGVDAGLKAARAAWIAGAAGTSNVLAGIRFGIPVFGTMAHSFVMAFDDELEAFRVYAEEYPDAATLLVDTYDTEEGLRRAAAVGRELAARGHALQGVRLDSGDVVGLSRTARRILDEAGLPDVRIFVSGDLNELRIAQIVAAGAPVDAFGVGTELGVVADAPALQGVYKLVEYAGRGRAKRSPDKQTLGGRKQVWRRDGGFPDVLAREGVEIPGARPLLSKVMESGRVTISDSLAEARARCTDAIAKLDSASREVASAPFDSGPRPEIHTSLS
jgi:nicotinate phosphoribosyltransferase